jgi:hypothetical protein
MLGLGAVFPAIIAEQRDAFAAIEGENAAASAAALLQNPEFVDFSFVMDTFNKANNNADDPYEYIWAVQDFNFSGSDRFVFNTQFPETDFSTGMWDYDAGAVQSPDLTLPIHQNIPRIPMSARLFPQPYSGKEPKFVWDIAIRREPTGDRLQAAIFVRRVDARIRVPQGNSLSDVLTGGQNVGDIAFQNTRLPVGIFSNPGDARSGSIAVDSGPMDNVYYAQIQMLKAEVHPERLDWLVFADGLGTGVDKSIDFATQIGQKLVDNTGVVRTVVGNAQVDRNDPLLNLVQDNRVVIVDPPFQPSNAGGNDTSDVYPGNNLNTSGFDSKRASWVRQVIFTPREPVAVKVVTIGGES